MIENSTIQEIIETAKIEEVVGDYVNLRRRGSNMIGVCPFHDEKTPSFSVSPTKNIFKCFGCGKGGDSITFIMEHDTVGYIDAVKHLANKYGIEIQEKQLSDEVKAEQQRVESLYLINEYAQNFYHQQLLETDIGKSVGLSYLKQRGFANATIEKFKLGYAPKDKDALTQAAKRTGYKEPQLKDLGLTSKYGSDFFRDRVMFTIHSASGKVVGFGGRTMSTNKKTPKYVNTPETEIYNKSKILYGIYFAKREIRKTDQCILVEGYTDVISLHQIGIENVVASSGTALTVEQIHLIKRYTPNIKIIYDGDAAGIKAALRGLDMVLEQDMNVEVVLLPEGEDPDSYSKKLGTNAFKDYIKEHAKDFILFKSNLLLDEAKDNPIKKAGVVKDIVESIAKVPDPIKRSMYIKECAKILDLDEQLLINETNKVITKTKEKENKKRIFSQKKQQSSSFSDFPPEEPGYFPEEMGEGGDYGGGYEDMPPPDFGSSAPSDMAPPSPVKPKKQGVKRGSYQERSIVRLLISFGNQWFDEGNQVTVANYILASIEDVLDEIEDPLYRKVIDECFQLVSSGDYVRKEYFLNHDDVKIQELAKSVLHQEFKMSEGWIKNDLDLKTQEVPEENFSKDTLQVMYHFKYIKVRKIIQDKQEALKTAEGEEMMHLLKIITRYNSIAKELANEIGTIIR